MISRSLPGYVVFRLPLTVEPVFREWLERTQPLRAEKVESLLSGSRDGRVNNSDWGRRMVGTGAIAEQIKSLIDVFRRKLGFEGLPRLDCSRFRPAVPPNGLLKLF